MRKRTKKEKAVNFFSSFNSKRSLGFLTFFILALVLPITVVGMHQSHETKGHAAGATLYPANIDFPVSGYATPDPYGQYNAAALTNPYVDGVAINLNWQDVEPSYGVFNWTPLDNEMQAWGNAGKRMILIIRYLGESGITTGTDCNAKQGLPSWEIPRIKNFCDTDTRMIIPDYFDPVFIGDTQAYVQAIADHIAQSPYKNNITYVRIGVGLAGEGMPIMHNQPDYISDIATLTGFGYSSQNWETWQENMLSFYQTAFPWVTVIYPVSNLDSNAQTGNPIQMDVAYWAAAHGFGVGSEGLAPNYTFAQVNVIFPYIIAHWPHTYIQFQPYTGLTSATQLQSDISTATAYGGRTVEWFDADMLNPSYQQYFQNWEQYVDTTFAPTPTPTSTPTPTPSPTFTPTPTPSSTPTPTQIPRFSLYINAGGSSGVGAHGAHWLADTGYSGGQVVDRGNISIANTINPWVYQTERYGMSGYSFSIPNGTYLVHLDFAENSAVITGSHQRVFDITVQGQTLNSLDIYSQAGGKHIALVKSFTVSVKNGVLMITFKPEIQNPEINGIEIIQE